MIYKFQKDIPSHYLMQHYSLIHINSNIYSNDTDYDRYHHEEEERGDDNFLGW